MAVARRQLAHSGKTARTAAIGAVPATGAKRRSEPRPAAAEPSDSWAAALLLQWYDRARRDLPWRAAPGTLADPYRVWLSEMMLQQTTVKAVVPYYHRFLERFPTVAALAAAEEEDVLRLWAGLGYYSRARNLYATARQIATEHGGAFPDTEAGLRALPGIGPYTAAAIAAIAFDRKATVVDGNVERVVARLFAVTDPLPRAKARLKTLAATLTPAERPGDFAQAMMDLGATVCVPKRPSCLMCPLKTMCRGREAGIEATLPRRSAKAERPTRHGIAFVAVREDGYVLLRRRPDKGLLARMTEVPCTPWLDEQMGEAAALKTAPVKADWWAVPSLIEHAFTHFRLELKVFRAVVPLASEMTFWADQPRCRWVHRTELADEALPSVMRKILAHALRES